MRRERSTREVEKTNFQTMSDPPTLVDPERCSPALRDAACDMIREASAHMLGADGHLIMCFSTGSRVASVRVEFVALPEVGDAEDDVPVKADR
jgi:hypothetical protein